MLTTVDDELWIGGLPASALVEHYSEPLYVYDAGVLDRQVDCVRRTMPAELQLLYSMKANPNPAVVAALMDRIYGVDVSSLGELHGALKAGCPAARIFFVGPSKSPQELREAVRLGVGCLIAESEAEIRQIDDFSAQEGVCTRVGVRINPAFETAGARLRMGGAPRPFGIDEELAFDVVTRAMRLRHIDLLGLHVYVGTRILDWTTVCANFAQTLDLAIRVVERTGLDLRLLDLGGGFGVPYFAGETPLDIERVGTQMRDEMVSVRSRLPRVLCVIELGRYLVAEAGVYLTRVRYVKQSRGHRYALVSGGLNHHQATTGLGGVARGHFPIVVANKMGAPARDKVSVCGPLCTPADVLARSVELPDLEPGDLVAVLSSGAYGLTASPVAFLSHEWPCEVLVRDGRSRLIRGRPKDDGTTACMSANPLWEDIRDSVPGTAR